MPKKSSISQKDMLLIGAVVGGFASLYKMNSEVGGKLAEHVEDCSKKSQAVYNIAKAIFVAVAIELIMRGFNLFELAHTTQATTTVTTMGTGVLH